MIKLRISYTYSKCPLGVLADEHQYGPCLSQAIELLTTAHVKTDHSQTQGEANTGKIISDLKSDLHARK